MGIEAGEVPVVGVGGLPGGVTGHGPTLAATKADAIK
jgi:hypothetical protein